AEEERASVAAATRPSLLLMLFPFIVFSLDRGNGTVLRFKILPSTTDRRRKKYRPHAGQSQRCFFINFS
ncbi:MAG TPA: hypothetical protein PK724_09220, partial [Pseudomonadales bacterium]|nr:hypothetical protein [Pseudomonadales bacterium]